MKFRALEGIFVLVVLLVTVFNMVAFAIGSFSYDVDTLPKGKFKTAIASPSGEKILRLYLVDIEDVGSGVRGTVTDKKSGTEKTVCWKTGTKNCNAKWINENILIIDGSEINLLGDPYDSRKQIELPEGSAKNRAYENGEGL